MRFFIFFYALLLARIVILIPFYEEMSFPNRLKLPDMIEIFKMKISEMLIDEFCL